MACSDQFSIVQYDDNEKLSQFPLGSYTIGYVYVLEADNIVKIGKTMNIQSRLRELKYSLKEYGGKELNRIAISVLHKNYGKTEKYLHSFFSQYRKGNTELFDIDFDTVLEQMPDLHLQTENNIEAVSTYYGNVYKVVEDRTFIIKRSREILTAPQTAFYTYAMIADLYHVSQELLRRTICRHKNDLAGAIKMYPKDIDIIMKQYGKFIKEYKRENNVMVLILKDGRKITIPNSGTIFFDKSHLLRFAYYISNGIAQEVRHSILDYSTPVVDEILFKENKERTDAELYNLRVAKANLDKKDDRAAMSAFGQAIWSVLMKNLRL